MVEFGGGIGPVAGTNLADGLDHCWLIWEAFLPNVDSEADTRCALIDDVLRSDMFSHDLGSRVRGPSHSQHDQHEC